ncbi:hypothetical protein ZIOFF_000925 [Zingiber officinale]|uniref:C2H2-type domain-containing protein n=1 Tax=Zingiber officinale TaxID=94328 RepID=A0A8J5IIL9_ZINOF|nr:hypothetical protein ZIOFF_000925 [Zingiber officinale]
MENADQATPPRLHNRQSNQTSLSEESRSGEVDDRSSAINSSRSFDCTFCKRGFSNAQALGGHMNLHRRDKARLKRTSPCAEFPFNVAAVDDGSARVSSSLIIQPLPALAEESSSQGVRGHDHASRRVLGESDVEEQRMEMHREVDAELDLELRLGR